MIQIHIAISLLAINLLILLSIIHKIKKGISKSFILIAEDIDKLEDKIKKLEKELKQTSKKK